MRAFLALSLAIAAVGASPQAIAHALSKQECVEGGDFIAHAADARENGMSKSAFLDRLKADITLIQAFPPELRWFVVDSEDAEFLLSESSDVFDSPQESESHRAQFLEHCFDHSKPPASGSHPGVERLARSVMTAPPSAATRSQARRRARGHPLADARSSGKGGLHPQRFPDARASARRIPRVLNMMI